MSVELTIAAKVRPENFIFAPILMNGVPGIGKTAFAQAIADAFKLPFLKLAAGGLQGNFRIVGSAAHWGNTEVGDIYRLFSNSEFATGVILLDEVDKVDSNQRFNAIPALLDLLESESAQMLKDESLCVRMDASKLIILATSNYMEQIEPALLSRLQIHEIAPPTPEQKTYIAERLFQKLTRETKSDIALDAKSLSKFVQQPIDLRLLGRAVRSAFARATAANSKIAFMPAIQSKETARKIGFV